VFLSNTGSTCVRATRSVRSADETRRDLNLGPESPEAVRLLLHDRKSHMMYM
jgi:hypothetical protein